MTYPIEKYRFYTTGNKVIAVSTYAGKTVRGVARCAPEDTFDMEKGKQIAAARCAVRIAEKRFSRAERKETEAWNALKQAESYMNKMSEYVNDADDALYAANCVLDNLLTD